jgi:hypothetical protein
VAALSDFPQAASISANAINGFRTGESYRSGWADSRSECERSIVLVELGSAKRGLIQSGPGAHTGAANHVGRRPRGHRPGARLMSQVRW